MPKESFDRTRAVNDDRFGSRGQRPRMPLRLVNQPAANDDSFVDEAMRNREAIKERARQVSRFRQKSALGRAGQAFTTALADRQAIAEGDFSVFIFAFVVAVAKDAFLDMTWVLGFPAAIYLCVFAWGRGTWKIRLTVWALNFLDMIPVVGILPMATISVAYIYYQASKKRAVAQKELELMQKSV